MLPGLRSQTVPMPFRGKNPHRSDRERTAADHSRKCSAPAENPAPDKASVPTRVPSLSFGCCCQMIHRPCSLHRFPHTDEFPVEAMQRCKLFPSRSSDEFKVFAAASASVPFELLKPAGPVSDAAAHDDIDEQHTVLRKFEDFRDPDRAPTKFAP